MRRSRLQPGPPDQGAAPPASNPAFASRLGPGVTAGGAVRPPASVVADCACVIGALAASVIANAIAAPSLRGIQPSPRSVYGLHCLGDVFPTPGWRQAVRQAQAPAQLHMRSTLEVLRSLAGGGHVTPDTPG